MNVPTPTTFHKWGKTIRAAAGGSLHQCTRCGVYRETIYEKNNTRVQYRTSLDIHARALRCRPNCLEKPRPADGLQGSFEQQLQLLANEHFTKLLTAATPEQCIEFAARFPGEYPAVSSPAFWKALRYIEQRVLPLSTKEES